MEAGAGAGGPGGAGGFQGFASAADMDEAVKDFFGGIFGGGARGGAAGFGFGTGGFQFRQQMPPQHFVTTCVRPSQMPQTDLGTLGFQGAGFEFWSTLLLHLISMPNGCWLHT
jgi:hypothetical protein